MGTANHFVMYVVGKTKCGKTHYVLDFLTRNRGMFNYIFIICPTIEVNDTYLNWRSANDPYVLPVPCPYGRVQSTIRKVYETAKAYAGNNYLVIIDDCAASAGIHRDTGPIIEMAMSGRHWNISMILISQCMSSLSPKFRRQISHLVAYYNPSKHTMKALLEEYLEELDKNPREWKRIKDILMTHPHSRIEVHTEEPYSYRIVVQNSPECSNGL